MLAVLTPEFKAAENLLKLLLNDTLVSQWPIRRNNPLIPGTGICKAESGRTCPYPDSIVSTSKGACNEKIPDYLVRFYDPLRSCPGPNRNNKEAAAAASVRKRGHRQLRGEKRHGSRRVQSLAAPLALYLQALPCGYRLRHEGGLHGHKGGGQQEGLLLRTTTRSAATGATRWGKA
jgi:hypothetical protein